MVQGDKDVVEMILKHPSIQAISFVGSTPIAAHVYATAAANGKRVQAFGGAKNHAVIMPDADMDMAADAMIGAGYGSAGERCMAIAVAVPVGEATANRLVAALKPRVEALKVGPYTDAASDFGPVVNGAARARISGLVDQGVKEGAQLVVDGRGLKMQGYENGFYMGPCLFDRVTTDMEIYRTEIFGPVLSIVRSPDYESALLGMVKAHEYGNGVAIFTRDGDAAQHFANRCQIGMVGVNLTDPHAAGLLRVWRLEAVDVRRPQPARPRFHQVLDPYQDRHGALALRHQVRRRVLHARAQRNSKKITRLLFRAPPITRHSGLFCACHNCMEH